MGRAGPAIALSGVNLSLGRGAGRVHILKDIDLHIGPGEAIGLVGPSGSGKSTLLMVMAGLERADTGSVVGAGIHYLTLLSGAFGLILGNVGAIALLHRRLTDEEVEGYTSPAHIFNIVFFIIALLTAFFTYILVDQTFVIARGYVHSLLTFEIGAAVGSPAVAAEFVLFSLLLAYVPLTHMSHFFTKYFFYHEIRWNDEPNFKGSRLEKQITEALGYPVSWSARHLKADGRKNWADIATEEVDKE